MIEEYKKKINDLRKYIKDVDIEVIGDTAYMELQEELKNLEDELKEKLKGEINNDNK